LKGVGKTLEGWDHLSDQVFWMGFKSSSCSEDNWSDQIVCWFSRIKPS
jgi:hypothetical protein